MVFEPRDHTSLSRRDIEAIEKIGVDVSTLPCVRRPGGIAALHHLDNREIKTGRERMVPIVVCGTCVYGDRAVGREHVVRDPNRHGLVVHRIDGVRAGKHASLFLGQFGTLQITLARCGFLILLNCCTLIIGRELIH